MDKDNVGMNTTTEVPKVRTRKVTEDIIRPVGRAQLVVLAGSNRGKKYPVENELTIGRNPACEIWIPDEGVSRRHVCIRRVAQDEFVIEDLGSRNGTSVNGLNAVKQLLAYGDKITIGTGTLLFFTHIDPMEDQLLQVQKMEAIGRLAAGVSHEFNNLLSVVMNNLSLLGSRSTLDAEETDICISEAKQAVIRGAELTRQMLDFSNTRQSEKTITSVTSLVQEIDQFVQRTFGPSIDVHAQVEPDLVVHGDRVQLYQVLLNLCLNARDAISTEGTISLRARALVTDEKNPSKSMPKLLPGNWVEIAVEDTGAGMDDETLQKVFEPFFTTKETGKGTGLGLSIVMGIIHSQNGEVTIRSEPNRGTAVHVFLPRVDAHADDFEYRVQPGAAIALTGTVLVVDDENMVCRSLKRTLQIFGMKVLVALDGIEAVRVFEQNQDEIDLVILDMVMPGLGGQETFSILKKIEPAVKVLISTGYANDDALQKMLDAGARGVLKKPYEPEMLGRSILSVLESSESPDPEDS